MTRVFYDEGPPRSEPAIRRERKTSDGVDRIDMARECAPNRRLFSEKQTNGIQDPDSWTTKGRNSSKWLSRRRQMRGNRLLGWLFDDIGSRFVE
jgi:hypothetical protein